MEKAAIVLERKGGVGDDGYLYIYRPRPRDKAMIPLTNKAKANDDIQIVCECKYYNKACGDGCPFFSGPSLSYTWRRLSNGETELKEFYTVSLCDGDLTFTEFKDERYDNNE